MRREERNLPRSIMGYMNFPLWATLNVPKKMSRIIQYALLIRCPSHIKPLFKTYDFVLLCKCKVNALWIPLHLKTTHSTGSLQFSSKTVYHLFELVFRPLVDLDKNFLCKHCSTVALNYRSAKQAYNFHCLCTKSILEWWGRKLLNLLQQMEFKRQ